VNRAAASTLVNRISQKATTRELDPSFVFPIRLMHEEGISARTKRRFVKTTVSNHDLAIAPNLLARNFFSSAPNEV
jgi:hypothetical protein